MGTFNSSKTFPYHVEDIAPVARDVMDHFEDQDFEVTETNIPTGGVQVSIRRDLRPASHPHGDHPTGLLARDNRAGMEHGPGVQAGRGSSGRRRREPESSRFESARRGNRRVTEPKRGGVPARGAARVE